MDRDKHHPGCPLCGTPLELHQTLKSTAGRVFYKCPQCWMLHCDRDELPDETQERDRYNEHINEYDNPDYTEFLGRAWQPTIPYLKKSGLGLDFGCGPIPVLASLIRQSGFRCDHYDPLFFPDLPQKNYDFIISTEVIEHFHHPKESFAEIIEILNEGGILTLMTECWTDLSRFPNWYYIRDDTHVSIYHQKTLDFIARQYDLTIIDRPEKRVTIFRKNDSLIGESSY
jgi:SAM-dependent methyltransferase